MKICCLSLPWKKVFLLDLISSFVFWRGLIQCSHSKLRLFIESSLRLVITISYLVSIIEYQFCEKCGPILNALNAFYWKESLMVLRKDITLILLCVLYMFLIEKVLLKSLSLFINRSLFQWWPQKRPISHYDVMTTMD